jgi:hypothetical protein
MEPKVRAHIIQAFTAFKSADGTSGVTNTTGGLLFKDGLYVGGNMSAESTGIAPDSVTINGTGGDGYVLFSAQSANPVLGGAHIYATSGGRIAFGHSGSTAYNIVLGNDLLTAERTLNAPNKNGTIATTGDNVSQFVNDAGYVVSSRTISAGVGLAGGGSLAADRTISMGTPSEVNLSSVSGATGTTHTHTIATSSNPGAAASILATDGSGFLRLNRLGIGASPTQPLQVAGNIFVDAATANLYMKDTSTGLQSSTSGILTLQTGNSLRSPAFTSGVNGWDISAPGRAEFLDGIFRGELRSSVFRVNEVTATAGTFIVAKSAAVLTADTTTPATVGSSFNFTAKNSDGGVSLFAAGDLVQFKTETPTGIANSWARVDFMNNTGAQTEYNAALMHGSTNATFKSGTGVVDYGPAGSAFISLSADGTIGSTPNLTMATHSGTPWTSQTILARLGNLNGFPGYATNVYGLGVGSGTEYFTIDPTNGLVISAAGGSVKLDISGLSLPVETTDLFTPSKAVTWRSGATVLGGIYAFATTAPSNGTTMTSRMSSSSAIAFTRLETENESGTRKALLALRTTSSNSWASLSAASASLIGLTIGSGNQPEHMLDVHGDVSCRITVNDQGYILRGATTGVSPVFKFATSAGTVKSRVGIAGGTNGLVTGAAASDLVIRSEANAIWFTVDGGVSGAMKLTSANQVQVRIGGVLKTIEEGAADSGGAGKRMLVVVN